MLVHSVFFTLKDGLSEAEKAHFIEQVGTLGNIPTVDSIYIGTPAATPDRPVIRKDYDVALTVLLKSLDDHDVYQEHQIHLDFIKNNSKFWESVIIFDAD
ncbi:MAG: Dabb family protein [Verrucomicrobiae bacterium]|nr:Dabb family protein [Verrucomicrobiae bacterium]